MRLKKRKNGSALFFSTGLWTCVVFGTPARKSHSKRAISHNGLPGFPGRFQAFSPRKCHPPGIARGQGNFQYHFLTSPHEGPDGQLLRHLPLASSQSNQHEATASALVNRHGADCLGGMHTGAEQGRRKRVLSAATPHVFGRDASSDAAHAHDKTASTLIRTWTDSPARAR